MENTNDEWGIGVMNHYQWMSDYGSLRTNGYLRVTKNEWLPMIHQEWISTYELSVTGS